MYIIDLTNIDKNKYLNNDYEILVDYNALHLYNNYKYKNNVRITNNFLFGITIIYVILYLFILLLPFIKKIKIYNTSFFIISVLKCILLYKNLIII